jgi:sister chromatid cohesion protein DCC1
MAILFGISVLRNHAGRAILIEKFLEMWKESIPIRVDWSLDINDLHGNFIYPTPYTVQYFTKENLSKDPKIRFQQLLTVKNSWELTEILPFIDEIRNKSVKLESYVMKYARKRTVGKKIMVSARH